MRKSELDAAGLAALPVVTSVPAFGSVIAKFAESGFQSGLFAGAPSVLAPGFVALRLMGRGLRHRVCRAEPGPGLLIGLTPRSRFQAGFWCRI